MGDFIWHGVTYNYNEEGWGYSLVEEGFWGWKPTLDSDEFDIVKVVNLGHGMQLRRFCGTFSETLFGVFLYKIG